MFNPATMARRIVILLIILLDEIARFWFTGLSDPIWL